MKRLTGRPAGPSGRVVGPVVAALAAGVLIVTGLWWWAPQVGYRVEPVTSPSCLSQLPGQQGSTRAGTDQALLPLTAMSAPLTATVCRPDRPHVLVHLDEARTAHLAAVVDTPQGGWPDDALVAKRVPPVTATAAAGCPATLVALLRFDYPSGAPVSVRVTGGLMQDGEQCLAVDNGRVRWRVSPAVAGALATALEALPTG